MGHKNSKEKRASHKEEEVVEEVRAQPEEESEEESEFLIENAKHIPFTDEYDKLEELGAGAFGTVYKAARKTDKKEVAAKCISKARVATDENDLKCLHREIEIMQQLDHPHVLKLFDVYESEDEVVLILEIVKGGELFDKIVEKGSFSEDESKDILRQTIGGLLYMHERNVAHRDLKPENLLCAGTDDKIEIKIADFGLSKVNAGADPLKTACGTPDYAAPEVISNSGSYSHAVDMWAIGVIGYILLCGFPPFFSDSLPGLFSVISAGRYSFNYEEWSDISDEAKDFIAKLLVVNPEQRMTAAAALEHPWLKVSEKPQLASRASSMNFAKFAEYNKKRNQQRL